MTPRKTPRPGRRPPPSTDHPDTRPVPDERSAQLEPIATRISEAFWYARDSPQRFQPAHIGSVLRGARGGIAWLDQLLDGGLHRPGDGRALTILITGRPGAGKSVLAMELCYRWALHGRKDSLLVSSEGPATWLKRKAQSFGWASAGTVFALDGEERTGRRRNGGSVHLLAVESLKQWTATRRTRWRPDFVDALRDVILPPDDQPREVTSRLTGTHRPDILVIDSINSVPDRDQQASLFSDFNRLAVHVPEVLVAILDSGPRGNVPAFWEYVSDVVFRADWDDDGGYLVRTFEVIKARFQKHVWGKHQLKIYEPTDLRQPAETLARAHPFRSEGGIFIFPSIHYILSLYKKKSPIAVRSVFPTAVPGLETLLPKGYPPSRCTALLGNRGGHKSHLGYLELLSRLIHDPRSRAIVVSLRDDEQTTRNSMEKILSQQWKSKPDMRLDILEHEDRLEILYYPPGYITPEEFFHRLLVSIHRLKDSSPDGDITLLFNSLDQLKSRFPLCAREGIFVPGIVQMLSAEGISSFFVAAREPDQPPEYSGLESLAELILNFTREGIGKEDYIDHTTRHRVYLEKNQFSVGASSKEIRTSMDELPPKRFCVLVEVERYAGGQAAGAKGILELIDQEDSKFALYGKVPGLHFLPLPT